MEIREACNSDIGNIADMVTNYMRDSQFSPFAAVERHSISETLTEVINDDAHVLLVATDEGLVVGTVLGEAFNNCFRRSALACREMFWWVEPEYRHCGLGTVLIRELEMKVKLLGMQYLSVGCVEPVEADLLVKGA